MHTRALLSFVLAACLAVPALGSGGGGGHGSKGAKPAAPGTSVEMPFLIAPMSKDGKLLGYAYISSKLVCSSGSATVAVREKLAFIQDANVRDVNARPVSRADDPIKVDDAALSFRLLENAKRIVGPHKVVRMTFTQIQFAPLHPSESTLGMLSSKEQADALAQAAAAKENITADGHASAPIHGATSKPPKGPAH